MSELKSSAVKYAQRIEHLFPRRRTVQIQLDTMRRRFADRHAEVGDVAEVAVLDCAGRAVEHHQPSIRTVLQWFLRDELTRQLVVEQQ